MTNNFLSRRKFFTWGGGVLAASTMMTRGVAEIEAAAQGSQIPAGEDYYAKFNVTPFINAAGTYTFLTASIMPPQVRAAVERTIEDAEGRADQRNRRGCDLGIAVFGRQPAGMQRPDDSPAPAPAAA